MLGKKFLILAMVLIAMVGTANAAITVTINSPTAGQGYQPNFEGLEYIDINVHVVDSTAGNAEHGLAMTYAVGDTNTWITSDTNAERPGNDANISITRCNFSGADEDWTAGADCIWRYTLPLGNDQIPTGNYVLDVNVTAYDQGGKNEATGLAVQKFSIDNRWVNTAVEALLVIIPVVLIAALVVGIVLVGFGVVSGQTILILAVGAIISIIAVVVLSGIMGVLTP